VRTHTLQKLPSKFVTGILSMIVLFMVACNFSFNQSKSNLDETDVASVIESTLNAEWQKATEAALAVTEALPAPPTSPPATDLPLIVETSAVPTAEIQSSPTAVEAVPSSKWYTWFTAIHWVPLSTGCVNMSVPCYKLLDDIKILEGESDAILTAGNDILVEESWPSPYLVYSNQRSLKHQASLNLIVDGKPVVGRFISPGDVNFWKEEYLDLSGYKGKKVRVQFVCPVGRQGINSWFVNDMRIDPEYKPE